MNLTTRDFNQYALEEGQKVKIDIIGEHIRTGFVTSNNTIIEEGKEKVQVLIIDKDEKKIITVFPEDLELQMDYEELRCGDKFSFIEKGKGLTKGEFQKWIPKNGKVQTQIDSRSDCLLYYKPIASNAYTHISCNKNVLKSIKRIQPVHRNKQNKSKTEIMKLRGKDGLKYDLKKGQKVEIETNGQKLTGFVVNSIKEGNSGKEKVRVSTILNKKDKHEITVSPDNLTVVPEYMELKVGERFAFSEKNGKEHKVTIGKLLGVNKENVSYETYDGNQTNISLNNTAIISSIKKMAPGQRFDLRELTFPILGKSFDAMKEHFKELTFGEKTAVITGLTKEDQEGKKIEFDAKIQISRSTDGEFKIRTYEVQESLEIGNQIMGVKFDNQMKEDLIKGKTLLIPNFNKNGKEFAAYVTVDNDLNSLALYPKSLIKPLNSISGVSLTPEQKEKIYDKGEKVLITGMTNKKEEKFDALISVDVIRGKLKFDKPQEKKKKKTGMKV
jgi:hypothetical protein